MSIHAIDPAQVSPPRSAPALLNAAAPQTLWSNRGAEARHDAVAGTAATSPDLPPIGLAAICPAATRVKTAREIADG